MDLINVPKLIIYFLYDYWFLPSHFYWQTALFLPIVKKFLMKKNNSKYIVKKKRLGSIIYRSELWDLLYRKFRKITRTDDMLSVSEWNGIRISILFLKQVWIRVMNTTFESEHPFIHFDPSPPEIPFPGHTIKWEAFRSPFAPYFQLNLRNYLKPNSHIISSVI